MHINVGIVNK